MPNFGPLDAQRDAFLASDAVGEELIVEDEQVGQLERTGVFRVSALVAAAAMLLLGAGDALAGASPDVNADTIGCYDQDFQGGGATSVFYLSSTNDPGLATPEQWTAFGDPATTYTPVIGKFGGANASGLGLYEDLGGTGLWSALDDASQGDGFPTDYYALPIEASVSTVTDPIPLAGNWAGNGSPGVGFYYPDEGVFVIDTNPGNPTLVAPFLYGPVSPGNVIPVVGDWDGDGNDTVGVYDRTTGIFHLVNNIIQTPGRPTDEINPTTISFRYGDPGNSMIPVAGDWDLQAGDSIGLYDPSDGQWRLRNTNTAGFADILVSYGGGNCQPIAGNWNIGTPD